MSSDTNPPAPPAGTGADTADPDTADAAINRKFAPKVFIPSAAIILLLAITTIIFSNVESKTLVDEADASQGFKSVAEAVMDDVNDWVTLNFGWYYVVIVAFFIVASLAFGLSRFGKLRLASSEDERPEFTTLTWYCMLFSAGMGIGLVFWGAAEPLYHLNSPAYLPEETAGTNEAARDSMLSVFMHWGIHAWAIYVVLGLAVAVTVFRRNRPVSIRWVLEPLLGKERVKGALGDLIDVIAVVSTLFGVATSLGLGSAQINSGLKELGINLFPAGGENADSYGQVIVILVVTSIAIWSVVTGVKKGMKWLSNINMTMAAIVLLFFIVAGPTLFIFREFFTSLGYYFQNLLAATFDAGAFPASESAWDAGGFQAAWTAFYWGWWISWAPFVAIFVARISKGRTIREFCIGILVVPSVLSFVWFSALGGTAMDQQMNQGRDMEFADEADALFLVLSGMPWTAIMTGVCTILVITFFVTSSDSGSLVIDMLATGGNIEPPTSSRVFWSSMEGFAAIALLLAGGLAALQTFVIVLALPFSLILIAAVVATWRSLRKEYDDTVIKRAGGPPKVTADAPKS